jgi:16S rRNA (guanine527-N7)-methyltransferase
MVLKHYVDSLLVLRFLELPTPLIDMGSGPGLPGVPLAIARSQHSLILAEPRGARVEFLRRVCNVLSLDRVEVYPHKLGPDYPGKVAGVISRAVAQIPETLDRVAGCLELGGRMIFMKGPECHEEIAEAQISHADSFRQIADHAYAIPGTTHHRRLVVYERLEGEPPIRPRPERSASALGFAGPLREIASESNPSFRLFRDLLGGPGIRKHQRAILAGPRLTAEVLNRFPEHVVGWLTDAKGEPPPLENLDWFRLSNPLFAQLDVSGTKAPLLLVRTPQFPSWPETEEDWPMGCSLFVPFQDPENVGAVIRSAAAFGVAQVVLLREAAHPFHPRASRAAGPALFQVPLVQGPSIREISTRSVPLIALDTAGPDLAEAPFPERFGLVVGLEGPGLPETLRLGARRRIPIAPNVESLNAATAASIALYAWSSRRAEVAAGGEPMPMPNPIPEPNPKSDSDPTSP